MAFTLLLHVSNFPSLSVDCLCLEFVGLSLCRSKQFACPAAYKSSVVDIFTVFIASFPYIDLWLFMNKFCLEIVVAYC